MEEVECEERTRERGRGKQEDWFEKVGFLTLSFPDLLSCKAHACLCVCVCVEWRQVVRVKAGECSSSSSSSSTSVVEEEG